MDAPALAAVFVVGLLGGVHCIGMCGGVVTALSAGSRTPPSWPVQFSFNFGWMRSVAGAMVLGLGLYGLAHAGIAGQRAVGSFLCLTI